MTRFLFVCIPELATCKLSGSVLDKKVGSTKYTKLMLS